MARITGRNGFCAGRRRGRRAAGAVEAVICVMALTGQWLPGSLNIRELDPVATFDVVRSFRRAKVKVALTNSFGFGGTNATVVMKQA